MNGPHPFENAVALLVGISYEGTAHRKLPRAPKDAVLVGRVLKRLWAHNNQVDLLLDSKATSHNLWESVYELGRLSSGRLVKVYLAGHAERETFFTSGDVHFVTHDSTNQNGRVVDGVSLNRLTEKLAQLAERGNHRILLYADMCYAGDIDFTAWPKLKQARFAVFGSCGPMEHAWEDRQRSHFTRSLVEVLCGLGHVDDDGYVTAHAVASYLNGVTLQTPQVYMGPDFFVGRNIWQDIRDELPDCLPSGVKLRVGAAFEGY